MAGRSPRHGQPGGVTTAKAPRQVGDLGGAENSVAGGGPISSQILSDKRAALRRLLHQIDLDEQLRRRSVQQTISQAQAWWWRWRAEQFDQARPRPSDFNGQATPADLAAADERCRGVAEACLGKAALIVWEADDVD